MVTMISQMPVIENVVSFAKVALYVGVPRTSIARTVPISIATMLMLSTIRAAVTGWPLRVSVILTVTVLATSIFVGSSDSKTYPREANTPNQTHCAAKANQFSISAYRENCGARSVGC